MGRHPTTPPPPPPRLSSEQPDQVGPEPTAAEALRMAGQSAFRLSMALFAAAKALADGRYT